MSGPRSTAGPLRRLALVLAAAALMITGFGGTMSAAWASASGTVNTAGASLTVRSGPHVGSTAVGSLADGASITIDCQTYGDTVTGTYGTSNIWDHVPAKGGYVSDTYVYTGSDTLVAPLCGGTPTQSCSGSGPGQPANLRRGGHLGQEPHDDQLPLRLRRALRPRDGAWPTAGRTAARPAPARTGWPSRGRTSMPVTATSRPVAWRSSPAAPAATGT